MQTSESEEGLSVHKSLTSWKISANLDKYRKKYETIEKWNSTVKYHNMKNKLSNK